MEKVEVISECKTPSVISSFLELWDKKNNQCIIIVQKRLHELKNCLHFVSYTFITHRDNIGRGGYARNWHSSININYHQINTSMSQSSRWTFGFTCISTCKPNQIQFNQIQKEIQNMKYEIQTHTHTHTQSCSTSIMPKTYSHLSFYDFISLDKNLTTRIFLYYLQHWGIRNQNTIACTFCCTWGYLTECWDCWTIMHCVLFHDVDFPTFPDVAITTRTTKWASLAHAFLNFFCVT